MTIVIVGQGGEIAQILQAPRLMGASLPHNGIGIIEEKRATLLVFNPGIIDHQHTGLLHELQSPDPVALDTVYPPAAATMVPPPELTADKKPVMVGIGVLMRCRHQDAPVSLVLRDGGFEKFINFILAAEIVEATHRVADIGRFSSPCIDC
jgi:hypothetical protein